MKVMRIILPVLVALFLAAPAAAVTPFTGTYDAHDDTAWFVADTCRLKLPVVGAEPDGAGPFPVFMWAHGTGAEGEWKDTDANWATPDVLVNPFDQAAAKASVNTAASAGFVSFYPVYRGRWTVGNDNGTDTQAACMLNRTRPSTSALDVVCARPKADCSQIVVGGHSQGGMIALRAANWSASVKAVYATGVFGGSNLNKTFWSSRERGGTRAIPDTGVRTATGTEDLNGWLAPFAGQARGDYSGLRTFTGLGCPDLTVTCTRADGSGWHVVQHAKPPAGPTDGFADHCFMSINGNRCNEPQPIDPFWLTNGAPWTLGSALDWFWTKLRAA